MWEKSVPEMVTERPSRKLSPQTGQKMFSSVGVTGSLEYRARTVWTEPCQHWARRATKNCFVLWALMHCLLKKTGQFCLLLPLHCVFHSKDKADFTNTCFTSSIDPATSYLLAFLLWLPCMWHVLCKHVSLQPSKWCHSSFKAHKSKDSRNTKKIAWCLTHGFYCPYYDKGNVD